LEFLGGERMNKKQKEKFEKIVKKTFPENIFIEIIPDGDLKRRRPSAMSFDCDKDELIIRDEKENNKSNGFIKIGLKTKNNNEICMRYRKCNHDGKPHLNVNLMYNGRQKNKDKFGKDIFPKGTHRIEPIPKFLRIIIKKGKKEVYNKNIEVEE
jgi:hypothetical protein